MVLAPFTGRHRNVVPRNLWLLLQRQRPRQACSTKFSRRMRISIRDGVSRLNPITNVKPGNLKPTPRTYNETFGPKVEATMPIIPETLQLNSVSFCIPRPRAQKGDQWPLQPDARFGRIDQGVRDEDNSDSSREETQDFCQKASSPERDPGDNLWPDIP